MTTAERLRREAMVRSPDSRIFHTGLPLATLQHVVVGCDGTPRATWIRRRIMDAIRSMEKVVPMKYGNGPFRNVCEEARQLLQAADAASVGEAQWRKLGRMRDVIVQRQTAKRKAA